MNTVLKIVAATALATTSALAEMKPGACPVRNQNKPMATFDKFSMAGLWYEYVWDAGYMQGYDYKCSTWIILSNENEGGQGVYQVYNNMITPAADTEAEPTDQ